MLQAATQLNLKSAEPVALWRLTPVRLRKGEEGGEKVKMEEARALVLIICYLARNSVTADSSRRCPSGTNGENQT